MRLVLLGLVFAACLPLEAGLFDRVVIFGASVSAEEKAPSPGRILAQRMGARSNQVLVLAHGGAGSRKLAAFLDRIFAAQPTLIVAVDLFFHDYKFSLWLSEQDRRYLRDYIGRLQQTGAVLVLGNIPPQVFLRYQHVNRYLEQLEREFPRLVLIDLAAAVHQLEGGGLKVMDEGEPRVLFKRDVFADRVHPNLAGTTLLANLILARLWERFPAEFPRNGANCCPPRIPLPPAVR
jgi:hypothetical protein